MGSLCDGQEKYSKKYKGIGQVKKYFQNFGFAMEQWKSHKGQILFLAVQIISSFLLLAYMFQMFYSYQQFDRQITRLMGEKEIFIWRDRNDNGWQEELLEEKYHESFLTLLDAFLEREQEILVVNNQYSTFFQDEEIENLSVSASFFQEYGIEGDFSQEKIEENFQADFLEEEEFLHRGIIPAVAGAYFREDYDLGDCITDDFGQQYEIIGFMEKGETYAMPTQDKEPYPLDKTLVMPVCVDISDNGGIMEYLFSCQLITEDRQELKGIEDVNFELGLLDGYFVSYREQLEVVRSDTREGMLLFGMFGVILFLFSMVGLIGMLIQLFMEYECEYGIHMLCGAKEKDIFIRLVFQVTLLMLFGLCVAFAVFGFGKPWFDMVILALFCLAVIYLYSYRRILQISIIKKIRRSL